MVSLEMGVLLGSACPALPLEQSQLARPREEGITSLLLLSVLAEGHQPLALAGGRSWRERTYLHRRGRASPLGGS